VNETVIVEIFGVHGRGIDIGKHLELATATHVVSVARGAIRDQPLISLLADLTGLVGLNHSMFLGHAPNPAIGFNRHVIFSLNLG
jgi:hypothetical protein